MARPDREPEPELLVVAAHELGHATVLTALGITVVSIEIDRDAYSGLTSVDLDGDTCTADELRASLIGQLAGYEAERGWCRRHGGHAVRECSTTDFAHFHRHRHRVGLTETEARAEARATLAHHWHHVERLAHRLAHRGHVQPW
jgi:hypothetical protein